MEKIKCITFDREAQEALPEHIKAKMKADREEARKKIRTELRCVKCGCEIPHGTGCFNFPSAGVHCVTCGDPISKQIEERWKNDPFGLK